MLGHIRYVGLSKADYLQRSRSNHTAGGMISYPHYDLLWVALSPADRIRSLESRLADDYYSGGSLSLLSATLRCWGQLLGASSWDQCKLVRYTFIEIFSKSEISITHIFLNVIMCWVCWIFLLIWNMWYLRQLPKLSRHMAVTTRTLWDLHCVYMLFEVIKNIIINAHNG